MSSDGELVLGVGLNRSKSARVRGHRAAGREPEACGVTTIPPALALPLRVEALLYVALTPTSECSPAPEIFFCKNAFCQKGYPLLGAETIFGQVFGRGGMTKFSKWKVPPTGGSSAPQQPFGRTNGARGSPLFIAPPSRGLMLAPSRYDCTVPAQTPSLMSLTTLKSRRWADEADGRARPAVIAAARLRESCPRRAGWSLSVSI